MQSCWAPEPRNRPSFLKILRVLDRAAVDCLIDDSAGRKFWHHNFVGPDGDGDSWAVDWNVFAPAFAYLLGADDEHALEVQHSPTFQVRVLP